MLDGLICQQGRRPVQDDHLHLAIGILFQVAHDTQLPLHTFFGPQARIKKHSNVYVAQPVGLPARRRPEQVSCRDVGLTGEIGGNGFNVNLQLSRWHRKHLTGTHLRRTAGAGEALYYLLRQSLCD